MAENFEFVCFLPACRQAGILVIGYLRYKGLKVMGDPRGFLKTKRLVAKYRPVCERIKDYKDVVEPRSDAHTEEQASRCMDCGTPFCNWACPIGNHIPEWNDYVFRKRWKKAFELLDAINPMPEITGRLCPAMCEYACVLGINDDPATIHENELAIIEHAFRKGYIKPNPPKKRTGKKVAVIGSGPAGLAAAVFLNKMGHKVTVFERDKEIGGMLRYGIPDFKLEKKILDRRINLWKKEGIIFFTCKEIKSQKDVVKNKFDAVCLAGGSRVPRDLKIEGRNLSGIHYAMDYLMQSNRLMAKELKTKNENLIDAKNKRVLVIGGGDTGADCVGTANRQGATYVVQIELLEKPTEYRPPHQPWPLYPMILKTSSSHEEGADRQWSIATTRFIGENNNVKKVGCVRLKHGKEDVNGCPLMQEIPGSMFAIDCDLVILAIGFLHPEHTGLVKQLRLKLDKQGNVATNESFMTSRKGVFACGDMRRGQSLIVHAINEGRRAAKAIDMYFK